MAQEISGARIVVTAGCSGIGQAIAAAYAKAGARIAVCDVDPALIAASPHLALACDVADETQVSAFSPRSHRPSVVSMCW